VAEAARILDLEQHLDRKPANLSGGQRQRVAMGRAIVRNPSERVSSSELEELAQESGGADLSGHSSRLGDRERQAVGLAGGFAHRHTDPQALDLRAEDSNNRTTVGRCTRKRSMNPRTHPRAVAAETAEAR
jgi:hypothetical protein